MAANKPELKPLSPWKVPREAVDEVVTEHNIPSIVFPNPSKLRAVKNAEPAESLSKFSFDIPEEVAHQVRQRALDDRCTNQVVVMKALSAYGFNIPPEAMVDKRRKKNRKAV